MSPHDIAPDNNKLEDTAKETRYHVECSANYAAQKIAVPKTPNKVLRQLNIIGQRIVLQNQTRDGAAISVATLKDETYLYSVLSEFQLAVLAFTPKNILNPT